MRKKKVRSWRSTGDSGSGPDWTRWRRVNINFGCVTENQRLWTTQPSSTWRTLHVFVCVGTVNSKWQHSRLHQSIDTLWSCLSRQEVHNWISAGDTILIFCNCFWLTAIVVWCIHQLWTKSLIYYLFVLCKKATPPHHQHRRVTAAPALHYTSVVNRLSAVEAARQF